MFSRAQVRRILQRVPGKQRLGIYRFLPFFFVLGGTMEWIMIKVRVGQETFYDVYRRKASERQYQRRLEEASETELQQPIKLALYHLSHNATSGFFCLCGAEESNPGLHICQVSTLPLGHIPSSSFVHLRFSH